MHQTVYSHSVRILTCEACGAPLQAALEGGSFVCEYCGVAQIVSRRAEVSGAAASTDLSESERFNRLRAQQSRLEAPPPFISALMDGPRLRAGATQEARALWTATRVQLGRAPSFPLAQKLFHLTVVLAPALSERDRRAILETAAELLSDGGHGHVFRCMLSKLASCAGDPEAAARWLEGTDERPTDLLMDSVYRIAAAALSTARGDLGQALQLFGTMAGDVPIAPSCEADAFYLRVNALERVDAEEAGRELLARVERLGLPAVRAELAELGTLKLCASGLREVETELESRRRGEALARAERDASIAAARLWSHRSSWTPTATTTFLAVSLLASVLLALPWTLVVAGLMHRDPLFGAHAELLCPLICEGCTGPYQRRRWYAPPPRRPRGTAPRGGRTGSVLVCSRRTATGELEPGVGVSGGTVQLSATMIPICSPVGMLIGLAAVLVARRRWSARERQLLEEARERDHECERLPRPHR